MKKGILAIAIVALMMLPLAAMAGMLTEKAPISDNELQSITGQTGVTIDMDILVTSGYLAYGDDSGDDAVGATYTDAGYFTQSGLFINNGAGVATSIDGLTIDVGTDVGDTTALIIGLPSITGNIGFGALQLGTAAEDGASLGSLTLGDFTLAGSTVAIYPH